MKQEADELLKVDALGRVWMSAERREWLLDEFERSGVAGAEFARIAGVKYSTFATWLQRRRRATGGYPAMGKAGSAAGTKRRAALPGQRFVEAQIEGNSAGPGGMAALRVELPGGARMEIADGSSGQPGSGAVAGAGCGRWLRRCGHVEFHRRVEGVPGSGALRHAQGF
jgi:hypothetical protein